MWEHGGPPLPPWSSIIPQEHQPPAEADRDLPTTGGSAEGGTGSQRLDKWGNGGWQGSAEPPGVCGAGSWHSIGWTVPPKSGLDRGWARGGAPLLSMQGLSESGGLPASRPPPPTPQAQACSLRSSGPPSAHQGACPMCPFWPTEEGRGSWGSHIQAL